MKDKPYFHEISTEEIEKLKARNVTWTYIVENYSQPEWCTYPEALRGKWGCWTLTDHQNGGRIKISEDFCSTCEHCKLIT
mgnify:CR=1 FL=1